MRCGESSCQATDGHTRRSAIWQAGGSASREASELPEALSPTQVRTLAGAEGSFPERQGGGSIRYC
jgi:hypothetical protein